MRSTDATTTTNDRREAMLALLLDEQRRVVRGRRQRRRIALGSGAALAVMVVAIMVLRTPTPSPTPLDRSTHADSERTAPTSDSETAVASAPPESRWTIRSDPDPTVVERLSVSVRRHVPTVDDDALLTHLAAAGRTDGLVRIGDRVLLMPDETAPPNGG